MTIITKKNLIILNSVLFVIVALVVFTAIKPFLSPKQVVRISGNAEAAPIIMASEQRPERKSYDVIAVPEKNIFESKIKPVILEKPLPPPRPLRWELQGTWKDFDGLWHAGIIDKGKPRTRGGMWVWEVKAGERIDEYNVEILEVRRDYVKYLRRLPDGTEKPEELTYTGLDIFKKVIKEKKDYSKIVQLSTPNHYVVDFAVLKEEISDTEEFLKTITIEPNYSSPDKKEMEGYKLVNIPSDSILIAMGIQKGDIIKKVNDILIDSPKKASELFEKAQNEKTVRLEIIRGIKPIIITYDIKEF